MDFGFFASTIVTTNLDIFMIKILKTKSVFWRKIDETFSVNVFSNTLLSLEVIAKLSLVILFIIYSNYLIFMCLIHLRLSRIIAQSHVPSGTCCVIISSLLIYQIVSFASYVMLIQLLEIIEFQSRYLYIDVLVKQSRE